MAIMLVTYDVHKSDERRNKVLEFIKKQEHLMVSESCYLIDTSLSIEEVYDGLLFAGGMKDDYVVIGPIDKTDSVMLHSNDEPKLEWIKSRIIQ